MNPIADATDLEISQGFVSIATLKKFQDAEDYGTATPMQWLIKRLLVLRSFVESNRKLHLFDGKEVIEISNSFEFDLWCSKVLPTCLQLLKS